MKRNKYAILLSIIVLASVVALTLVEKFNTKEELTKGKEGKGIGIRKGWKHGFGGFGHYKHF